MRGRRPKPSQTRARRQPLPSAATLPAKPLRRRIPRLPPIGDREWLPITRSWWRDVWRSPMAARLLRADFHALYRLAGLIDAYWRNPTAALSAEIRIQEGRFGLTPGDRERLQLTVVAPEVAERPKTIVTTGHNGADPRAALRAVT